MNTRTSETESYSGTYLGKTIDIPASELLHPVVPEQPSTVPFVGGTLSISSQAVGMRINDDRIHHTDLAAQIDEDGVICEDTKTFGGPRSVTGGWSARLQRRFFLTVRQLVLDPIKNSPDPLALIVCKFPKAIRTNRELSTKANERLIAAIKYKLGKMRAYPLVWNFEFHWDGNVHINYLLAFPATSYKWLLKKWAKIACHEANAAETDVLHVTRFADFDEEGNELSFEEKFFNAAAYMAGVGELLGFIKAHQYDIPEDWSPEGEGSGRMWGARGLGRAKVSHYPIENLAQKEAIEAYMAIHCPERLTEYKDPKTGQVTIFNDGAYSPTRRAGSIQCLAVTEAMNEDLLDLLELHAAPLAAKRPVEDEFFLYEEPDMRSLMIASCSAAPAMWERDDWDLDAYLASEVADLEAHRAFEEAVAEEELIHEEVERVEDVLGFEQLLIDSGWSKTEQRKAERTARRNACRALRIDSDESYS